MQELICYQRKPLLERVFAEPLGFVSEAQDSRIRQGMWKHMTILKPVDLLCCPRPVRVDSNAMDGHYTIESRTSDSDTRVHQNSRTQQGTDDKTSQTTHRRGF